MSVRRDVKECRDDEDFTLERNRNPSRIESSLSNVETGNLPGLSSCGSFSPYTIYIYAHHLFLPLFNYLKICVVRSSFVFYKTTLVLSMAKFDPPLDGQSNELESVTQEQLDWLKEKLDRWLYI